MFKDCIEYTVCPRCGADSGKPCRLPSGRRYRQPHVLRLLSFKASRYYNPDRYRKPLQKITQKERDKGRSEGYYGLTPIEQWAEDKKLGILDWDGE